MYPCCSLRSLEKKTSKGKNITINGRQGVSENFATLTSIIGEGIGT
jgi:hypothetical protein